MQNLLTLEETCLVLGKNSRARKIKNWEKE
jgi:hypothetical protein